MPTNDEFRLYRGDDRPGFDLERWERRNDFAAKRRLDRLGEPEIERQRAVRILAAMNGRLLAALRDLALVEPEDRAEHDAAHDRVVQAMADVAEAKAALSVGGN